MVQTDEQGYSLGSSMKYSYTNPFQPAVSQPDQNDALLALLAASMGGGGGGGSGRNDALDSRSLDITEQNNLFNQKLDDAQFRHQQAMDERDYALAVGDQKLAERKQNDANHWEQVGFEVQQAMNAANNAADIEQSNIAANASMYGSRVGAQATVQSAQIRAEADRQASRNQLQANLANAINDADRNRAIEAFNREQAAIAKMEDDTKRMLGVQQNQTAQFGAETDRMGVAGNLAQKQNEFILNAATSPRDLFGLYFMQRGVTPDWEAIKNGNPAIGDPLTVQNALTAYKPTGATPVHTNVAGPAYNTVGQATAGFTPQANPYISMGLDGAGGGGGGGATSSFTMPDFGYTPAQTGGTPKPNVPIGQPPTMQLDKPVDTLADTWSGVRAADYANLKSGQGTYVTTGLAGASRASDFLDYNVFNPKDNTQYSGDQEIGPGAQIYMTRKAQGGYTNAQNVMTGDAAHPDPWAGGAKPEMIENPTGAPLRIKNTAQTAADFGVQTQQQGGEGANASAQHLIAAIQETPQLAAMLVKMMAEQPSTNQADFGTQAPQQEPQRFALGTDAGQAYANAGMGSLYLQGSDNAHLQGQELAPWIKTLSETLDSKGKAVPISPSLQAATTGQIAPNLNMGSAFTQRGGGSMSSLQGLNNMSKGEMENYRGYSEGVVGVPWADMVDYLGRPTKNLQTAGRSKASFGY